MSALAIFPLPQIMTKLRLQFTLPWYRNHEPKCKEANIIELKRFNEYDAYDYEEVNDIGHKVLGTTLVLTEKVKVGGAIVKARHIVRRDQEDTGEI